MASPPRRFLLLPEEGVDVPSQGPRIRRYRLASVARRRGPRAPGSPDAVARAVGEHGHPGGTYD
ncbi:MAG TPA: hypothetical protein VID29_10645 [Solirubrobacteraceae bacterium]